MKFKKRFQDLSKVKLIQNCRGYGPLLSHAIAGRLCDNEHLPDPEYLVQLDRYLSTSIETTFNNPYKITGMDEVVNVVEKHLRCGSKILVYGDYDLDGISATTVLIEGFSKLSSHVGSDFTLDWFLPNRLSEGYGITDESLKRLSCEHERPNLIITVDCGISCKEHIAKLLASGVDVVVTDHHEASCDLPDVPFIDPKVTKDEGFDCLAGCGVALELLCAICSKFGLPNLWLDLCDIATLGTIADVMPLIGANRALVSEGLSLINNQIRPSLRAIMAVANNKPITSLLSYEQDNEEITARDLSFSIIPRLNSSGRVGQAEVGMKLLLCDNLEESYAIAQELESLNIKRKQITDSILDNAFEQVDEQVKSTEDLRVLFVIGDGWHTGVLGIVAARICSQYDVPTFVFSSDGEQAVCSVRSVGDVDIYKAICAASDILIRFGGHKNAAGLTVSLQHYEQFKSIILQQMSQIDHDLFQGIVKHDGNISLDTFTEKNVEELALLEPCGQKNDKPTFLIKNVFIKNARAVGKDSSHLSATLTDGTDSLNCIQFSCRNITDILQSNTLFNVVVNPKIEQWCGKKSIKLFIEKIEFAQNCQFIDEIDLNITNESEDWHPDDESDLEMNNEEAIAEKKKYWQKIAVNDPDSLQAEILKAIIGDGKPHESQRIALDTLARGKSALCVMPTGRGKSLIFQVYGAMSALRDKKISVFVYPLRALIADQAFHLKNSFEDFGLNTYVLSGETKQDDRQKIYEQMQSNQVDILLTTPEYLDIHVDEFAKYGDVGFLVLDESHHIGEVKVGSRTSYGNLPSILQKLNSPQVLALSATVSDDTFKDINRYLPNLELITDTFERSNMFIDDKRDPDLKDEFMVSLVASGQKTVIYANSRETTIAIARIIRSRAPHIALKVGFYNAGMSKNQRKMIENAFRDNKLTCLVATSAFGEGVNIPDIRHVILYHLPFSEVEFNQMSGRAGRDGLPCVVHLLYSSKDAQINTNILLSTNPTRQQLGQIYLWMKSQSNLEIVSQELQEKYLNGQLPSMPGSIMCAVSIFEELGLIKVKNDYQNGQNISKIQIVNSDKKVDLENSSRFVEGQNQILDFEAYRDRAMQLDIKELTNILRHPITPTNQD